MNFSSALSEIAALSQKLDHLQSEGEKDDFENFSVLEVTEQSFVHLKKVNEELKSAQKHLDGVRIDDVPEEYRERFIVLSRFMEPLINVMDSVLRIEPTITDFIGKNGSRKYLFLFQNNHEMRASGGFIGSYGFLDMRYGKIREFKIDGIYNPGGQLTDKVVPPRPIQKISAAWSLHDSNWWPHFPKSAEKAMDFYARTGGPSVDGVIAVTPTMIERLLEITGPIALPEYDVVFTSENFIEKTRYEIEVDSDKEENRPKKILSDLMPELMGELRKEMSQEKMVGLINILFKGLDERHIMFYSRNDEIQSMITEQQWGGRLLDAPDDYLSVVHSNINGFKTDGVIDEKITHDVKIHDDGRIINTVTIKRKHNGGATGWDWWDAVNADYLRVYVPKGSRLLKAEGHTPEWHEPRLDYDALGFERDRDVVAEESDVFIDPDSNTRVFEDSDKTVFGNWVYVSPQETVTVKYTYELPWRIIPDTDNEKRFSSYSILYQKQAGAQNVDLTSSITIDGNMNVISRVSDDDSVVVEDAHKSHYSDTFLTDVYHGIVFEMK